MPISLRNPFRRAAGWACLLSASAALVTQSGTAYGQTALPYDQDWSAASTTCGAQWSSGDCLLGWTGHGEDNTLDMVQLAGVTSAAGVQIVPGDTMPNGLQRSFAVGGQGSFQVRVPALATDGSALLHIRARFKNSSDVVVNTSTRTFTVAAAGELAANFNVPPSATTVDLILAATSGSDSTTTVVVGWFPGIPGGPFVRVNPGWDPPTPSFCEEFSGSCETNISCEDETQEPSCLCITEGHPICSQHVECSCPDEAGGESGNPWLETDSWN